MPSQVLHTLTKAKLLSKIGKVVKLSQNMELGGGLFYKNLSFKNEEVFEDGVKAKGEL